MRNGFVGLLLVVVVGLALSPVILAQTAPQPGAARSAVAQGGEQKSIADLSGIWEAPYERNRTAQDICGEGACNALQKVPPLYRLIITVEEPQMLPWAEEKYKIAREGIQDPNGFGRQDANPWFSACTPLSPAAIMLSPVIAFELRQFPDVVLLLFGGIAGEADHTVRRIYVDGRDHPSSLQPTWMGHSIGRYDGDTLVVDTIGINGNRWIDGQGHPHSDAVHLVERLRRVDPKSLEYEVTIEDPKAYKNSWRKKIVRELLPSGPRILDDANCEELLQMGTHYGAETKK